MLSRLEERARAFSAGSNHRLSRLYEHAALVSLFLAVFLWQGFAAAALGFYLASIALRREGL